MNRVVALNLTNFFRRSLQMYAFGDIKFKKPIPLRKVAYTIAFLIIWALPMFLIFGIIFNLFYFLIWLGFPIAAAAVASKPVFGGKSFTDYLKTVANFIKEPKGWTDLNNNNVLETETFEVESEIWISRRREFALLRKQALGESSS